MEVKEEEITVKAFLITAIQHIEKKIGLDEVDNEEQLINMALVYLYNTFFIGMALDSSEVLKDRKKFLTDVKTVENYVEGMNEGRYEYISAMEEGRTVSSFLHE